MRDAQADLGRRRALDPVVLLEGAVRRPSPSGSEGEVASYLVRAMARFCDEAFVDDAGNAVGRWGSGPLRVTFLGHIDTVPGDIPVRLDDDGVLHGRGAVDAKGSFCAALAAVARLPPEDSERLHVRLIGAVGEESPGSPGARYAVEAYERPDLVIVGEPSGWDAITLGYKGRATVTLGVTRANFHSAADEPTALETVVDAFARVRAFCQEWNARERAGGPGAGRYDSIQLSLQDVAGDNDGLVQRARAKLQFRLPPAVPPERLEAELRRLDLGAGVTLAFVPGELAYRSGKDTALAAAFRSAIRSRGGAPRHLVKTGTSDMNVVAPSWPVPMVAYGPGDAALDHAPDERIDVAEYLRAVDVLVAALSELARHADALARAAAHAR